MSHFLPTPDTEATSGHGRPPEGDYGAIATWEEVERTAERAYLGSLMARKPQDRTRCAVRVEPSHMGSSIHAEMLTALRGLYPWTDSTEMERNLVATLSRRFGKKQAQLEVADCLCNAVPWAQVAPTAQDVVNGWARRERVRLAKRILDAAHDGETVAGLLDEMARLWSKPEDPA